MLDAGCSMQDACLVGLVGAMGLGFYIQHAGRSLYPVVQCFGEIAMYV